MPGPKACEGSTFPNPPAFLEKMLKEPKPKPVGRIALTRARIYC